MAIHVSTHVSDIRPSAQNEGCNKKKHAPDIRSSTRDESYVHVLKTHAPNIRPSAQDARCKPNQTTIIHI